VNIIVVGSTHRRALVTEHLQHHQHIQHNCADYNLPEGWVDQHKMLYNPTGCLRAFRGHQDALEHVRTVSLVFEDDAVPVTFLWPTIALAALAHLDNFDWISLHGREYFLKDFTKVADLGHGYGLYTNNSQYGINGCCMAYWMKKQTAERFRGIPFDGFPADHYLWQRFKTALVDPSPFRHDRSQGSLIDVGTRA
jgi:hypothetical protein